jgi:predicted Zn-dependent protease
MRKFLRFAFLGLLLGCATSPLGRKQLILLPDGQMDTMGAQAFQQMKTSVPTDHDPKWNDYVRCVALPITEAAKGQVSNREWEIVVFRDETANAFALPGGKIGVHTGILKVAKTDAQLAAVLGHEVGHVIARHGNERMSEGLATQGSLIAVNAFLNGDPEKRSPQKDLLLGLLGVGAQFGIALPHSRTQESEADLIGLDLMARAGFNPRESVELWRNMQAAGGKSPPQWLSTHPANETRIENLEAHMPDAVVSYNQAGAAGLHPKCTRPN